ncbi:Zinc finger, RING-type [Dillenia turbinata]|uniref:Zinc finger, RING-type n=1 Tax=Dillenia turbinata TaxID=194707 RepID=A0AAN8VW18_9MAGN
MSWNTQMEVHYSGSPYSSTGSFIDFFEGLTYEHVNFIFSGPSHAQESIYPSMSSNYYKYESFELGDNAYFDNCVAYEVNDHMPIIEEERRPLENSTVRNEQILPGGTSSGGTASTNIDADHVECPRRQNNASEYQAPWQDNIDPDNMTYEELLELGEAVGTQNRGLSQELISLLPISKYKRGFFSRKKSRSERCVICQMEYKRGERRITLPCKHIYHACCGTKWLSINKACPICYTEVFGNATKHSTL